MTEHHAPADHGDEHGHDDHANVSDPLGPVDVLAWASGVAGIFLGLVVAACLFVAAGGI
ncbi:MAG TPA: hypothetical protein VH813_01250 [Candidatus Limnocylindrales bacterium]|jgi:hypothetical protein